MRYAIYARYSSDMQSEASVDDQIRICREWAEKEGHQIVEIYSDRAISGSSMILRPGIQDMMRDAGTRKFDFVISEALDRISRDQEEIAGIFKRLKFSNIDIFTLSEGSITELHIGLKGTMNALFLKDLGNKVHRGLRGRIEAGKSGGGNSYGYDVVKKYDGNGEPIRGDRAINPEETQVVKRIFRDYASGKSPKSIAVALNSEGIPSPSGKGWGQTTINGNRRRGTGILNNEIYIGKLIWNKLKYLKDPDSGKRVSRVNSESEWIIKDMPDLQIIEHDLWEAAKARQRALDDKGDFLCNTNRPKYLLSHLLKCGCCGGGFSMVSKDRVGCSTARNKGTCTNRLTIKRETIEIAVLAALQNHLMNPKLCKAFCDEYTKHLNELRKTKNATLHQNQDELAKIKREEEKCVQAILDGFANDALKEKMQRLQDRRRELETILNNSSEDKIIFHPNMADLYHKSIQSLVVILNKEGHRSEAAETLRGLIEKIELTPIENNSRLCVDLYGDLAGILSISVQTDRKQLAPHLSWYQQKRQVALVAGVGFEPTTFRL